MSEKVTTEKNKTEKVESLPDGWKRVRLGEVIEEVNNRNLLDREIPVLTSSRSGIYLQEEYFNRIVASKNLLNYKIIEKGQFTYRSMSDDEIFIFNRLENVPIGLVSPAYYVFKAKKTYSGDFLKYFINNSIEIRNQIYKEMKGTTRTALKFNQLVNFVVSLPPLPEQRKIAEILETVDNAIEKTDAIIEKYRRIKKGLMADLLTGKIRLIPYGHSEAEGEESPLLTSPKAKKFVIGEKIIVAVPNQRWKDSPIGTIPADWEVAKLGEVIRKIVDNRGRTPPIFEEGVELIETNCITDKDKKHPDFSKIRKYVNRYIYNTWFRSGHPEIKDILIATVGENVGSAAIMNVSRGCIAQNLVALKLNENVIPDFVYYLFISEYFYKQVFAVLMMAAQPSLKLPHLLNFVFPLPPLPEQQLIADVLSQVDEVIEKEIQYKEKLERIKKGLMEDLLTGKVRVNNLIKEDIQNDTKVL